MGNINSSLIPEDSIDDDNNVDGGSLKPPNRGSPENKLEYDIYQVKRFIKKRQLSPFYDDINLENNVPQEKEYDLMTSYDAKNHKGIFASFKRKKSLQRRANKLLNETDWHQGNPIECPICLSLHPRNINRTGCCYKPICTWCFINLRRPVSGRPISCPFCNSSDKFGIIYRSPAAIIAFGELEENDRRHHDHHSKIKLIVWEKVKPYFYNQDSEYQTSLNQHRHRNHMTMTENERAIYLNQLRRNNYNNQIHGLNRESANSNHHGNNSGRGVYYVSRYYDNLLPLAGDPSNIYRAGSRYVVFSRMDPTNMTTISNRHHSYNPNRLPSYRVRLQQINERY